MAVAAMDPETIAEVADVVRAPPSEHKFEHLKRTILRRMGESDDKQLRRLLSGIELGDKKPSQLLREMRLLDKGRIGEEAMRVRWLDLLPSGTQRILRVLGEAKPLEELAVVADELHECSPAVMATSKICEQSTPVSTGESLTILRDEVAALRASFASFRDANGRPFRPYAVSQHRPIPRLQSRAPSGTPPSRSSEGFCWYHSRFGNRATRCRQPCSFSTVDHAATFSVQEN